MVAVESKGILPIAGFSRSGLVYWSHMAPEYHDQRHAERPSNSPHLQAVITDLAAYYEVDLNQADARFVFARPEQDKQWFIRNLDGQHIDVAQCPVAADDFMVPDLDIVSAMTPNGWQTVKVLHTDAVWATFAKTAAERGEPPADPATRFPFSAFTEYVTQLIEHELRVEQAREAAEGNARLTLE